MPRDEPASTSDSPDPDPAVTAGLDAGGGVGPGDTPASSDSMSGTSDHRSSSSNMGPVSGNRTPMIITLSVLGIVVLMVALLAGASFFAA